MSSATNWKVLGGDCTEQLKTMADNSIDAVVTDPPYGLGVVKDIAGLLQSWIAGESGADKVGSGGFMGAAWDKSVPPPTIWKEVLRVLKPGGHLLVFAGTRTQDLMGIAIRLAGAELRDEIAYFGAMHYLYGGGFPKSLDVSKAIDKAGGKPMPFNFASWLRAEREHKGMTTKELCERGKFYKNVNHGGLVSNWESGIGFPDAEQFNLLCDLLDLPFQRREQVQREVLGWRQVSPGVAFSSDGPSELAITLPVTDAAKKWAGFGSSLKPSHENILCYNKPLTLEYLFAVLELEITEKLGVLLWQKLNVSASDVEKILEFILLRLEREGVSIAAENAKMCDWVSIENAVIAVMNSMSQGHILNDQAKAGKEVFVQENVNQNGSANLQECIIQTGGAENLQEQMVMLRLMLETENIDLSIISLWKNILEGILDEVRMFTISTALEMITVLKTLSCLLSVSILKNIIQDEKTKQNGKNVSAYSAESYLNAVFLKWRDILLRSVQENVILQENKLNVVPNYESIVLARKPLEGTITENILKHGTGGLNIGECRVLSGPSQGGTVSGNTALGQASGWNQHSNRIVGIDRTMNQGRWPANTVFVHHPECRMVGVKKIKGIAGTAQGKMSGKNTDIYGRFEGSDRAGEITGYCDENGFETVEDWECHEECPVRMLDEQSGELKSGAFNGHRNTSKTKNVLGIYASTDEYGHAGDSGGASRFFYCAKVSPAERQAGLPEGLVNKHPTMKPVELMRYLCRLVTPPGGTILDPFCGSGSTGIAARLEGFNFLGIEREAEYAELARHRIESYEVFRKNKRQKSSPRKRGRKPEGPQQKPLF